MSDDARDIQYEFNLDNMTIGEYADICLMDGGTAAVAAVRTITLIARSTNVPVLELPVSELRPLLKAFIHAVTTEVGST